MQTRVAPNHDGSRTAIVLVLSALAFLVLLRLFWVGFLGSDDASYWQGAVAWSTRFPYLGANHWTLRHTLVVPMALARAALGDTMTAMFLPSVLYALALIVLLGWWTWRAAGLAATAIAMALVITDPQLVLLASTADVDIPETFFILAAFFAFDRALARAAQSRQQGGTADIPLGPLLTAGLLMGLAILSRETAIFAVAAFGVLFLAGYGPSRLFYFVVGAGCALVVGLEALVLWAASGNWLYRANIDIHHDSTIDRWIDQGAAIPFIHPLIDPFTMFLVNHNFGLITWIGVPLTIWLIWKNRLDQAARRMAISMGTLALVWAALAAGMWHLLPLIPRYYLLPSLMVSVLAGVALDRLWKSGRRRLTAVLAGLLLAANLLALAADNRNFMFGVYTLADVASRNAGPVHTDPLTLRRASLLLEWAGTSGHATDAPARAGDLYFYNPTLAKAAYVPKPGWTVVERHIIPDSGGRWLACHLPAELVPASMVEKFHCGAGAAILYRVTG